MKFKWTEDEFRACLSRPDCSFSGEEMQELAKGYLEAHRLHRELAAWRAGAVKAIDENPDGQMTEVGVLIVGYLDKTIDSK